MDSARNLLRFLECIYVPALNKRTAIKSPQIRVSAVGSSSANDTPLHWKFALMNTKLTCLEISVKRIHFYLQTLFAWKWLDGFWQIFRKGAGAFGSEDCYCLWPESERVYLRSPFTPRRESVLPATSQEIPSVHHCIALISPRILIHALVLLSVE